MNRVTAGKGPLQKAVCDISEDKGGCVDSGSPLHRGTVPALRISQVSTSQYEWEQDRVLMKTHY